MAITTLDGVIAGMRPPEDIFKAGAAMKAAGIHHSLFYTPGRPGAAAVPAPGINGAALTTYPGQIPFTNPVAGNSYLARLEASSSAIGSLLLLDRLYHNSGLVVTTITNQAITFPGLPARDSGGLTNGDNIMAAIEVSTATTNAGAIANTTMTYTNQAGTASRTATIPSFPATAVAGTFVPFALQAGDTGIRSVQGVTLGTSYVAGAIHLVLYRLLAREDIIAANTGLSMDAITAGFPRLYDNTVPFLVWLASATTAINLTAQMTVTQG